LGLGHRSLDGALQNLQAAAARLKAAKASLNLTRDQLNYTTLRADFDGVITAVGAEAGQNVNAGQMVVKLARPDEKDGVFNIAEAALTEIGTTQIEVLIWPLSNPELPVKGMVREISPVADPVTRTYTVKVTLKDPPPQLRFGMSIGGRLKAQAALAVALPLAALFESNSLPAV
jgi:RND family efflux transporter MFP subunit